MKRLSVTLATLLAVAGLSMTSAQAATHHKKPIHKPKHHIVKKHPKKLPARHGAKPAPMKAHGGEVNMDIPADVKIDENRGMNNGQPVPPTPMQ